MKKLLLLFASLFVALSALAQNNDVTKFLGIPVDGTKSEMIQKLKAKGFTYNSTYGYLEGEFNGYDVNVHVVTNNNKVYRIMVCDENPINETDIKIRFNSLCRQFSNNPKYIPALLDSYTISDDEDISHEMLVNNKRYQAVYYQVSEQIDPVTIAREAYEYIMSKYSEEQLANPTDELRAEMMKVAISHFLENFSKKSVWFMISGHYREYYITMYYDNEYNRANGEDL